MEEDEWKSGEALKFCVRRFKIFTSTEGAVRHQNRFLKSQSFFVVFCSGCNRQSDRTEVK